MGKFSLCLSVLILNGITVFSGGIDITEPEFSRWYNLIDADIHGVEQALGNSWLDIDPSQAGSRAERILWFNNGISLWMDKERVAQLRFDSAAAGSAGGIRMGSQIPEVVSILGRPWIEADDNLYYNLPWRGGPVRLRLVFDDTGLYEIYIYIVR